MDSATEKRSVSLTRGTHLLSLHTSDIRSPNSTNILCEVDMTLNEASVKLSEIDLFAVATGPGSFTGLRAGLATVKAFAATLRRPLVGVPTLHAVAHALRPGARIVATIPAGRGEVFVQFLSVSQDGRVIEYDAPAHLSPNDLVEKAVIAGGGLKWILRGSVPLIDSIVAGARRAGVELIECSPDKQEPNEGEWMIADNTESLAQSIATLARSEFRVGRATSAGALQALYVRASDAELKSDVMRPSCF
ncbi:MAG: tRNA (adenosine(37)-N6)-threonylcarbamoyltransferase complex dimerization subunit type 1 TsaB [Acidobacteria bacterium]|nr:tRNA (adenosine(37)-N6)-threonylcarbamoyltransferase complex dimerization subunit type 1 TsaB [Acidobacteriota bacterium]